jgi:phosphomannomutase
MNLERIMERLFSADGIRGKTDYGILSPESLERLGMVLAIWWKESASTPEILIGSDTRESSERIKQRLVVGFTRGCKSYRCRHFNHTGYLFFDPSHRRVLWGHFDFRISFTCH